MLLWSHSFYKTTKVDTYSLADLCIIYQCILVQQNVLGGAEGGCTVFVDRVKALGTPNLSHSALQEIKYLAARDLTDPIKYDQVYIPLSLLPVGFPGATYISDPLLLGVSL